MATSDANRYSRQSAAAGVPLPPDSPLYLVRSEDEAKASRVILEPGALVRIRGSRGMGKTSLINQLLHQATGADCKTAYLSLREIDLAVGTSLDSFLREFCLQVANTLHIPDQLDEYWDDFFGSTICCKSYFEEYLLPEVSTPVVLALDDVDCIFDLQDLADDFFGLLRAWHEDAKTREIWQRLRLIVAHSTDLYVPQNINKSPFNVGFPIDLVPFSPDQILSLLDRWQVSLSFAEVNTLAQFVGGRPDLLQPACQALSKNGEGLTNLIQAALTVDGPFQTPLKRLQQSLENRSQLGPVLAAVNSGETIESLNHKDLYHLDSLGLIVVADQKIQFSCGLYVQWFENR